MNEEDRAAEATQAGGAFGQVVLAGVLKLASDVMAVVERHHADRMKLREREVSARERLNEMLEEGDLGHLMKTVTEKIVWDQDHRTDVGAGGGAKG